MKGKNKKEKNIKINVIIDYNVRNHGNEPVAVEKARRSKEVLEKYGFPEEYLEMKRRQL